ncbi:site-specific integrase [Streptococcus uberis]
MSIHKYQTKKGTRYSVSHYLGQDEYGKKKRHFKRGFKTLKEAKLYESRLVYQSETNYQVVFSTPKKVTYEQVYQEFIKVYEDTVTATTLNRTKDIYRLHILPVFGNRDISKISPLECQTFITSKSKNFVNIKQIKSYSYKVFDFAVKMDFIIKNPMSNITLPKRVKEKSRNNYFSVDELKEFLLIVKDEEPFKHYALFRLLAYTGARKGELYALRWNDINFETGILSITKNLASVGNSRVTTSTKNKFSIRNIYLDHETLTIMKQWKDISIKEKNQSTVANISIKNDYIFTYTTTKLTVEPLYADYINNILKKIIRNHNLKKISPHGFRHTHATLMLELGIDPVNTASRLGHASSQMTLDTYSHTTSRGEQLSINRFADYVEQVK